MPFELEVIVTPLVVAVVAIVVTIVDGVAIVDVVAVVDGVSILDVVDGVAMHPSSTKSMSSDEDGVLTPGLRDQVGCLHIRMVNKSFKLQ